LERGDLLWHIAEVQYFWGTIVERRLQDPQLVERFPRPQDVLPLFRSQSERLVRVLREADPSEQVWTWAPRHDVAFVRRRQAHEAAVHRFDAQDASGKGEPIDAVLAADGIDEFMTFMLPDAREDAPPLSGSVHLHCTDADGEWVIRESGDGLVVTSEHAKADAALRGPASDLLLALWRRRGTEGLEIIGDASVASRLLARADLR
jgi:uncharacterized protein (TIGR03083 family)